LVLSRILVGGFWGRGGHRAAAGSVWRISGRRSAPAFNEGTVALTGKASTSLDTYLTIRSSFPTDLLKKLI
jgi:hypothetical protein